MKTPRKYNLIERTARKLICGFGACPAIYSSDNPPQETTCGIGACPTIQKSKTQSYLIIGRQLSTQEIEKTNLAKKIGKGEVLIEVPKDLIDKMKRF
jgi:hypothetical protein